MEDKIKIRELIVRQFFWPRIFKLFDLLCFLKLVSIYHESDNLCFHFSFFTLSSYLLEHGADPLITDAEGNIALHWAALSGSYKTCEKLLNYGCDVNANNSIGETPM